jgi:hypothetical protein
MKIVSFPHYTCGGLLCDILNGTFSEVDSNGGIASSQHAIGKIDDSNSILDQFDFEELWKRLQDFSQHQWIGTHCWLGGVDFRRFDRVINITTMTYRSRLYRWLRAYHHYYLKTPQWQTVTGLDQIDKQRETAKNYLQSFRPINDERVINLEFAEVVHCSKSFTQLLSDHYQHHLDRWCQINSFLYDPNIYASAADRFYEADYEVALCEKYVYQ